jgi:predicted ester cyclase
VDFYQAFASAFPDFEIIVHTEHDLPGISIREVQIEATHKGEYFGLQPTGRRVSFPLMAFFLFDKTTGHLNAERAYFDNNTVLAQIRGELTREGVFNLARIEGR